MECKKKVMSIIQNLQYCLDELVVFKRNLAKDSVDRRKNIKVISSKFKEFVKFKDNFNRLREVANKSNFDSKARDEIKLYADKIKIQLNDIESILHERLQIASSDEYLGQLIESDREVKMSEKFELKTAAMLLPVMNGSETTTKQLIDAIELYDSMLDEIGKKLLITFILKKCLSQSAKIRLNRSYTTNADLIEDLKRHFITKKSVSHLSTKLNNSKQCRKSVDQFGKSIEELLTELTVTQSEGNEDAMKILGTVNEKIAINTFANGLEDSNLRTIIKARNYSKLSDAIQGAKDEECSSGNDQIYFSRGNREFNRGTPNAKKHNYGRGNRTMQNFSANRGRNTNDRVNLRPSRFQNSYRGNYGNRNNTHNARNQNFVNHKPRVYHTDTTNSIDSKLQEPNSAGDLFFRGPTGNE